MRACPKCGEPMEVAQAITVGGLEHKEISWRCDRDGLTAELRHPVQYVHLNVGDVEDADGRRRRLVHKEIRGAELVVYYQPIADAQAEPGGQAGPPAAASRRKRAASAGRTGRR